MIPHNRKTKKQKKAAGTLDKSREAKRQKPSDPASELEEAKEMLEVMKENLRQANSELREHGLMCTPSPSTVLRCCAGSAVPSHLPCGFVALSAGNRHFPWVLIGSSQQPVRRLDGLLTSRETG